MASSSASFSYERNRLERTKLVQLDGDTPAATTMTNGESDAVLISPYKYTATHTVDGKPISVYLKANANFTLPIKGLSNTMLVGTDYQMDRNLERDKCSTVCTPFTPEHRIVRADMPTFQPRKHWLLT